jgi:hypothetical protein
MDYFPNTRWEGAGYLAASIDDTSSTDDTWGVHFLVGGTAYNSNQRHVRAVSGEMNTGILMDNDDHTVTDTATGLMWQQLEAVDEQGEVRKMTWEKGLNYCETLELAGFDDWRLPNSKELQSIVGYEKGQSEQDLNKYENLFPNVRAGKYWSATTHAGANTYARIVYLSTGTTGRNLKSNSVYVRAVRGGQRYWN